MFRYQKILEVRISAENDWKNKLGQINKLIIEKKEELELAKNGNKTFLESVNKSMKNGIRIAQLQSIEHNKEYLNNMIAEKNFQLRTLTAERVEIQKELVEANKQRKVMEKLKEKEKEDYKALEVIEEAKIVDQIVTYNSTRKRGE